MQTGTPVAFGTLLRRYRQAASLTQEELSERAGLSARTIGDLERGVSHAPQRDTLALLAAALGLPAAERALLAEAVCRLGPRTGPRAWALPSVPAAPPFVGRTRELTLLERHLAGQGPPVLLVAGEPGIGKTRLLHTAVPRAVAGGWCVVEGGCQRRGDHELYAPLLGALQRHIRGRRPHDLRAQLRGCAWLVRLLPELAAGPIEPLPPWVVTAAQEQRLMVEALTRFLRQSAGPAGILLLLDDLQWAGPDALDLLATLARSATEVPLRVLGAYRDTEVPPEAPLSVMLADLAHAGLVARRLLGPLHTQEAVQLLEGLLEGVDDRGTVVREQVLQRTGGVPFFVVSCAQELRLEAVDADRGEAAPWDVAHSVRQRVAALSAAAREALGLAAVVGRVAERAVLVALSARPRDEVLEALDTACAARLLEAEGRDAYRFAHDIVREVVEGDIGAARRGALHQRVAELLEARAGERPIELLAYHYSRSGEQDKAVQYLEQAGDRAAAQHAHAAAERYYRDAVERLAAAGRTLDADGVREKLGAVLISMAQYEAALAVLEQAAEQHRAGVNPEMLGRIMAQIGWAHAQQGTPEPGVARLQPLLAPLEAGGPSPGLAALYIALARLCVVSGRVSDELAAGERAVDLARMVGDDRLLAQAMGRYGLALLHSGQVPGGLHLLAEARGLAESAGDLWTLGRTLINAASYGHTIRGEFALSRQYIDRAMEIAERDGDPTQIASAMSTRGMNAFFAGDWSQARVDVERAVALCRQVGASWALRETLRDLGVLSMRAGAWDEALQYLDESQWAAADIAECLLLQGHPAAAHAQLSPLLDGLCAEHMTGPHLLTMLAWTHLDLGETAQAVATVARAVNGARVGDNRLALVDALRVQAIAALRQERWAEAEQDLEEALTLARGMQYPYAEGRVLHVCGTLHTQKRQREPARARLQLALAIFRRLGAPKDVERVEQDLAALP